MTKNHSAKEHWENIYATKNPDQVSWTEKVPEISMSFINGFGLAKTAAIIDIGGGESKLVDFLLAEGYVDISILDISGKSIERAKNRLGHRSEAIKWIVQDVTEFKSDQRYDCWHDRAAFHFLTSQDQISIYAGLAKQYIKPNGLMIIGTFSENGPEMCSGLHIRQYNADEMSLAFSDGFKRLTCIEQDHITPFKTKQNFIYCSFQRV